MIAEKGAAMVKEAAAKTGGATLGAASPAFSSNSASTNLSSVIGPLARFRLKSCNSTLADWPDGHLNYTAALRCGSTRNSTTSVDANQCTFAPSSFKGAQIGELEETPGLSGGAWQMRPLSCGSVEPKSNRAGEAPAINPRYLPGKVTDAPLSAVWPNAAAVRRPGDAVGI
jgi:hypothetical protein